MFSYHCLHYLDICCQDLRGIIKRPNLGWRGHSRDRQAALSGELVLLCLPVNSFANAHLWLFVRLKCHNLSETDEPERHLLCHVGKIV